MKKVFEIIYLYSSFPTAKEYAEGVMATLPPNCSLRDLTNQDLQIINHYFEEALQNHTIMPPATV